MTNNKGWGGPRKGSGRPARKRTTRKVAFDMDLDDWSWISAKAVQMKTTVSALIRHAIQIFKDES